MDASSAKQFEQALLQLGEPRLRLDQVIAAYTKAFPSAALQADMRERLADAIFDLRDCGILAVNEDDLDTFQGAALPMVVDVLDRGLLN